MKGVRISDTSAAVLDEVWGPDDNQQRRALALAALDAFAEHGFHGATSRDIAARVGMSAAGLYVHYPSKHELLRLLSLAGHRSAGNVIARGLDREPTATALVETMVGFARWHVEHHRLARVVQYELRSLDDSAAGEVHALRHETQRQLRAAIQRLNSSGEINVSSPRETTRALLSLCIDISRWFEPDDGRSPRSVTNGYEPVIRSILGLAAK